MQIKLQIKSIIGALIFEFEKEENTIKDTLLEAIKSGAYLGGAYLRGADLRSADLRSAYLMPIKSDFFEILLHAIPEVAGLKKKLIAGEIDGSVYEGECCCLVGTIANERSCKYNTLPGIIPDSARPAERFFAAISTGGTPETNVAAKMVI